MRVSFFALIVVQAVVSMGQTAAAPHAFDQRSAQQISQQAAELVAKAKASATGNAGATLEKYPGHFTMLSARVKSGVPELHKHFNDIFVVVEGEATVLVGGTMTEPKEISPGEFHATSIEGGERHVMRKGDVIHISPDVPHQTFLAPGASFVYYVIKVEAPK